MIIGRNGKSAINKKSKLSDVAKHNLRKYRFKEYDRDNTGKTSLWMPIPKKEIRKTSAKYMDTLQEQLQQEMPDFEVANAVVHFDETSPHMYMVGVWLN